ncbi:MAG: (2Fe-2S)-binding protein [bacterium]
MPREIKISFTLNNRPTSLEVPANIVVSGLLRDYLDLTGTKVGCGKGECGACTVIVNGDPMCACLMFAPQLQGCDLVTVEGLMDGSVPSPVQKAFVEEGAVQCGYCIPGFIVSSHALLAKNIEPTEEELKIAISGNLCRCTGYTKIIKAIQEAAAEIREQRSPQLAAK